MPPPPLAVLSPSYNGSEPALHQPGRSATRDGQNQLEQSLRRDVKVAVGFTPMSRREMAALRTRVQDEAEDGRFELYKTTAAHDGTVGRRQHGYPSDQELSA